LPIQQPSSKIAKIANFQPGINDTFENKLQNWVHHADASERANREAAQRRILLAKETNAETLDLSGLKLTNVPPLDVLSKLKTLNLDNNRLSTLPEGCFKELTALQWLYLTNNQLSTLEEGCFTGLTALQWLYLTNNQLSTLEEGCFTGLTALQELYINDNQLSTLKEGCFKDLTALEWLDLSNNRLSTLEEGCFTGLTALKWLYLSYNQLTTLLDRGLSVDGDLYLEGCTGLTSLPESLSVGGDLYLKGCTGLTSLPEWVFELGDTQYVDATNTGIPVRLLEIYNHRQNEAGYSGPRIEFSILDNQSSDDVTADQLPQR
jgi:hypothetical protein